MIMADYYPKYYVKDTPCYPCRWKVTDQWDSSNATHLYHRTELEAQIEADRKNAEVEKEKELLAKENLKNQKSIL
jgi:hypothetical protein